MLTESVTDLSWLTIALLIAIMAIAGLVHGTLGLGFPMIATPLLSLLFDVRTAILLTLIPTIAVNIASIVRGGNWQDSIGRFWPLPVIALVGAMIGARLIVHHDPAPYKLLLALLIFLYLLTGLFSKHSTQKSYVSPGLSMLGFGLIAGIAAGSTNVMVPILIIYSLGLGLQPTVMVQVFNMTFLSGKIAQIGIFGLAGLLNWHWLQITTPLAAVGLVALFIGMQVRDRIPTDTFRTIIKTLLVLIAITLIGQYLVYVV